MGVESEFKDIERVVKNVANSLGIKLNISRTQFDHLTESFTIALAQDEKTLLLKVPKRCYEELRDSTNPYRSTELKAKIKKLISSTA